MGFQKTGHAVRVGETLTIEQIRKAAEEGKPNENGDVFPASTELPSEPVSHEDRKGKL